MDRKVYISNDVICLAECTEADFQILFDSWNEHETILGYNWKIPYSFKEYRENVENSDNWGAVILILDSGEIIGRIGISAGQPDLTITIFKPYRNNKYGTTAFSLGIKFCFETLKLKRLYAGCYEDNIPSRKMIESCGFIRNPEGDMLETHIFTGEKRLQLDFVIDNV